MAWHDWLNLDSLIEVSRVIARSALARENSRGAHFREDFPETGDLDTSRYIRVNQLDQGLRIDTAPVEFSIVRPGESLIDDEVGAPRDMGGMKTRPRRPHVASSDSQVSRIDGARPVDEDALPTAGGRRG